jgi:hypothetical protein
MLRVLQSVVMEDVQQALLVTAQSMQEFNVQLFKRLAALTELAARPAYDTDANAGAVPTDHSDALEQGTNTSSDQQQQQHQVHNSSKCEAAATASTAAPAVRVGAASLEDAAAASLRAAREAALEHVGAYLDYASRLFILVQLHNPVALYAAGAINLITSEPAVAPQQHWLMVSNNSQLSCRRLKNPDRSELANLSNGCRRGDAVCLLFWVLVLNVPSLHTSADLLRSANQQQHLSPTPAACTAPAGDTYAVATGGAPYGVQ